MYIWQILLWEKKYFSNIWPLAICSSRILRIPCGYLTDIQHISSVISKKIDFQQYFQKYSVHSSLFQNNKLKNTFLCLKLSRKIHRSILRIYAVYAPYSLHFPPKTASFPYFQCISARNVYSNGKYCGYTEHIRKISSVYPEYLVRCRSSGEPKFLVKKIFEYFN